MVVHPSRPPNRGLGRNDRVTAHPELNRLGMHRLVLFLLTCTVVAASVAAPLSPAVSNEIDDLMSRLEASGCEFNRNGSWHTATEAKSHLLSS
jgi:hypothetical protein